MTDLQDEYHEEVVLTVVDDSIVFGAHALIWNFPKRFVKVRNSLIASNLYHRLGEDAQKTIPQ
jgi:hypothetical protein